MQNVVLRAKGLHTFQNELSAIPDGALIEALNVIIDRNEIIEPRRGFKQYGSAFGNANDRPKQLIQYKNRLLVHYDNKLAYDSNNNGTFIEFDGTYEETQSGLRIKSVEKLGNLYFTTSEGIKKISALTASDFTNSAGYITKAGVAKALDVSGEVDYSVSGFLTPLSKVAYKVVWGIRDSNDVLVLGAPSSRTVIENPSVGSSAIVNLRFPIPNDIDNENYFYQVYRTSIFTAPNLTVFGDITPDEEYNLVFEEFVTSTDLSNGHVDVEDISPDEFRANGAFLYNNPNSGEGILQSNDRPPLAKDIVEYKGYIFYANTTTNQRLFLTLLGIQGFTSGVTKINIDNGTTTNTYTFRGDYETFTVDFTGMTFPGGKANLDGNYFTLPSAMDERVYLIWYDNTGSTVEPFVAGTIPIKVDITTTTDSATAIAQETLNAIELNTFDFNITNAAGQLTIEAANNGPVTTLVSENIGSGFTIVQDGNGIGEDTVTQQVFLPKIPGLNENGPTVSQQIDQAARSLVKVINADPASSVYAFYISGSEDVPGQIFFESRNLTDPKFSITADTVLSGSKFNPSLPTTGDDVSSENEKKPNRLYYSKYEQPEAVPIVNTIDIGPKDKEIQRILSLRDGLFIFKEDGIYRLTGEVAPFSVTPFDSSTILLAPDSAVVLNNLIYAFSTQGIVTVSDTGVSIISRSIEDKLLSIIRDGFNYRTASFGVGYETDRAYHLWTVKTINDTHATQCFRYNLFTNTWVRWEMPSTCGLVKFDNDKKYLGSAIDNFINIERKDRSRIDYADREYNVSVIEDEVNQNFVQINNTTNGEIGDVLLQTQYLTISQYNRLLKQLINDNFLTFDYTTLSAIPGDQLGTKLVSLINELNLDDNSIISHNFTNFDVNNITNTITINSHGFTNGMIVRFTNPTPANLPGGIISNQKYYIINSSTNDFQISETSGGPAFNITSGGTGTHTVANTYYASGTTDFETQQEEFNQIVEQLNMSTGVFLTNYSTSNGTVDYEGVILSKDDINNILELNLSLPFISGSSLILKAIKSTVIYAPQFFQDPSLTKQVSESTILFEDNNFSSAKLAYSTDLSPAFVEIDFSGQGIGDWGQFNWGQQNWGGISSAKPFRTLIPRPKQRCRWINVRFKHGIAFEKYAILGMSLTFRAVSQRGYR